MLPLPCRRAGHARRGGALPCPHCGDVRTGRAAELLVDQWTEPRGSRSATARRTPSTAWSSSATPTASPGCPGCDARTSTTDPASRCNACGAVTWVPAEGGGRVQLGVRATGERSGTPYRAVYSLAMAERVVPREGGRITAMASGGRAMSATALGCAVATFVVALLVGVGFIAARLFGSR
ncbi:MAG: hypothetical protein U0169_26625 [Polyangiaceae bacterium]